jgi:hypothetical protein
MRGKGEESVQGKGREKVIDKKMLRGEEKCDRGEK